MPTPPSTDEFQAELNEVLKAASQERQAYVDVNAGELHRSVGGYPTPFNRMPACCNVMRKEMKSGDLLLHEPPKGKGASLTIRYRLPRKIS